MRLFLAGTPGSGISQVCELLAAHFALEPRRLQHSSELKSVTLSDDVLIEFAGYPDAQLLEFLPQHGFKILTTARHPLDTLLAQCHPAAFPDFETGLLDYAASPRTHDLFALSLGWACVENSLVIRYEEFAHDPASALKRISPHLGVDPDSSATSSLSAPDPAAPDWVNRLSPDIVDRIYHTHRGVFDTWNYPRPAALPQSSQPHIPPSLRQTIADLEARNLQLAAELSETRARQASILPGFQQSTDSYTHQAAEISRLKHLLYGASSGRHLYRAWQVFLGNKNYRRPAPAEDQSKAPSVDPHTISGYHDLFIDDLHVRFHKAALADNRGTGRVARELFHALESLADNPVSGATNPRRVVHFFAAPHWGPDILPPQSCVLIHDTIPMLTPGYSERQLSIFETRCRSVIRQAAKLITISHTSARDIAHFLGARVESLHVIHNGVTCLPEGSAPGLILPSAPFLVYVGGGDSHKNLEVVFEALSRPAATDAHLVMVGANQRHRATAGFFGIKDRVHFLGPLEDSSLGYVLRKSTALVFPSIHEGFGLPPLEAAMLGVPSICSRRPAMTELLVDAALFAEPDSPDEWAQRIHAITKSPALRNAVAARAQATAEKLQWPRAARAYVDAFKSMPSP